jgi:hypothetical protein
MLDSTYPTREQATNARAVADPRAPRAADCSPRTRYAGPAATAMADPPRRGEAAHGVPKTSRDGTSTKPWQGSRLGLGIACDDRRYLTRRAAAWVSEELSARRVGSTLRS